MNLSEAFSHLVKRKIQDGIKCCRTAMEETGYNEPKTFHTILKRITGLSQIEYRKKYGRA